MPFHTDPNRAQRTAQHRGISPLVMRLAQRIMDQGFMEQGSAFGPGGTLEGLLGDIGGGESIEDLIAAALAGDSGGGGGAGGSFGSTQAGQEAANAFALQQLLKEQGFASAEALKERGFAATESEKARKFEREQSLAELKAERQRIFTDMLGTDPVRAVLFAMGVGGGALPGGERFASLSPLKVPGAPTPQETKQALSSILGQKIGLGEAGVTGLPSPIKAATAFSAGMGATGDVGSLEDTRTLLTSAFGVGATKGKGRPGQSRKETLRQIASVTPQGALGL